jgi:hypothetical protein
MPRATYSAPQLAGAQADSCFDCQPANPPLGFPSLLLPPLMVHHQCPDLECYQYKRRPPPRIW